MVFNNRNRALAPGDTESQRYEAAGQLLQASLSFDVLSYDAEGRVRTVNGPGRTRTYVYDGNGRRVQATVNGTTTTFVYDLGGELVAEYGGASDGVGGPTYLFTDHLGSTRLTIRASDGQKVGFDYLPFGEALNVGRTTAQGFVGADWLSLRFTGKERDTETGLDYFGARYLSGAQGRFTSPDLPFADQHAAEPQSWNLYGYVRNNPLQFIDPTGRELRFSGNQQQAQAFACQIYGASDCAERLSYDAKTGVVTFNTQGLDLSKNEGANLLNNLVSSKNVYELSIGENVQTAAGLKPLSGYLENLDRNPDPRYRKTAVNMPSAGVDDVVALNPNLIRVSENMLQPAKLSSILFHELAEAFAKIDGGLTYGTGHPGSGAHGIAIDREKLLRQQRPELYFYNFGGVPQTITYQKLPNNRVRLLSGSTTPWRRR